MVTEDNVELPVRSPWDVLVHLPLRTRLREGYRRRGRRVKASHDLPST
jgi:hypothetical protein